MLVSGGDIETLITKLFKDDDSRTELLVIDVYDRYVRPLTNLKRNLCSYSQKEMLMSALVIMSTLILRRDVDETLSICQG